MQLYRVGLARIAAITVVVGGLSFLTSFGHCAASADQLDDLRLKFALKAAFSLDPYLRVLPVTFTVEQGRVTVSGQVGIPVQKRLVMRKVYEIVDSSAVVDRVSIGHGKPAEARGKRITAHPVRDGRMALAVRRRLKNAADITIRDLRVAVSDGVVALNGKVDTLTDKEEAGRLAGEVPGVLRVINNLRLRGEPPLDDRPASPDRSWKGKLHDAMMLVRARRALAANGELAPYRIRVGVRNGIVTLKGEVPDEEKLLLAEQAIIELTGIVGVVNELRVKQ